MNSKALFLLIALLAPSFAQASGLFGPAETVAKCETYEDDEYCPRPNPDDETGEPTRPGDPDNPDDPDSGDSF